LKAALVPPSITHTLLDATPGAAKGWSQACRSSA